MNTTLNHRVTIYVPSTYEGNKPARRMARKATAHTARVFSALFGGATATTARGYWMSDKHGLIGETQTLVFSACTEADKEKHTARVIDTARALCRWMKQEAVTVEIDGVLQFVTAE